MEDWLNRSLTGQRSSVRAGLSAQVSPLQLFSVAQYLFQPCSSVRPCRIFFWGRPVTAEQQCQRQVRRNFFWTDRSHPLSCVSPRSKIFFCCPVASAQKCQPAQQNFLLLSGRLRAEMSGHAEIFLGCPVASSQRSNFFLAVRSHPRSSQLVQKIFFGRAAFSFAIRSHLRRTF
jgi:hypothetical protein